MNKNERLDYLDSLRGLAALAVIGSHHVGAYNPPPAFHTFDTKPLLSFWYDATAAVSFFFVLSGFVLSLKPFRVFGRNYPLREHLGPFYISRSTRIMLPFWSYLVLSYVVIRYFYAVQVTVPPPSLWFLNFWQNPPPAKDFFRQMFFASPFSGHSLIPQDGTLKNEMQFSLALPFLILAASWGLPSLLLSMILIVVALGGERDLLMFYPGVLVALYFKPIREYLSRWSVRTKALFLLLGLLLADVQHIERYFSPHVGNAIGIFRLEIAAVGCTMAMLMTFVSSRLQRFLQHPVLLFMGKISYSVFLTHFIVLLAVTPRFMAFLNHHGLLQISVVNVLAYLFTILVTTGIAYVSYHVIEIPTIRLGHSWAHRLESRLAPKTAPNSKAY